MAEEVSGRKCPACGSDSVIAGSMGMDTTWFREGGFIRTGWAVRAFVCRDCGVLTQPLSSADLAKLRAKTD